MGDVLPIKRMELRYPYFAEQIEPKGFLTIHKECHACWYYYGLAEKNHNKVGRGPIDQTIVVEDGLETPLWMDKNYEQIARSVALVYGLESPDQFARFVPVVVMEINRLGGNPIWEIFAAIGVRL